MMIVSVNEKPSLNEFRQLMSRTDAILNDDAQHRPEFYAVRGGHMLEDAVKDALVEAAVGTAFAGTIEKVSGQKFPDIVAARYYGVEVKSTKEDHWRSTGSSILETTRITDVSRIYMTFGKLGGAYPEFLSKPYEQCLYDIAVTHMPRYLINMRLENGETIFEKMNISYDELREMDDPIAPVSDYYRSKLKPGESLWWAGNAADETVPAKIRLWNTLSPYEKADYTARCYARFPEIFAGDYGCCSLWLTSQGIVNPHIRDMFSAGGKIELELPDGSKVLLPAVYKRVLAYRAEIIQYISEQESTLSVAGKELTRRVVDWCIHASKQIARKKDGVPYDLSMDALVGIFYGLSAEQLQRNL